MSLSKRAFILISIGFFLAGILAMFFIGLYREQKVIKTLVEPNLVIDQMADTIGSLEVAHSEQDKKILEMSAVIDRISQVVNSEISTVQEAIGMISDLRGLVNSLP